MSANNGSPSDTTRLVASYLQEAGAVTAMRKIALLSHGSRIDDVNAVHEAAAWATADILDRTKGLARRVEAVVAIGLPDPVLSVTGAGSLEVPWTNYMFRAMGGDPRRSSRCAGNSLAHAAMSWIAGGDKTSHTRLMVFREAYLGSAVTAEYQAGPDGPRVRCTCGHGCSVDLVLVSDVAAVAIEQKINAGASDWKCRECGGKQAEVYRRLFPEWVRRHRASRGTAGASSFRTELRYLSPTGRDAGGDAEATGTAPAAMEALEPTGWKALTHEELAKVLAKAWADAKARKEHGFDRIGDKFRMFAFFLDVASTVAGTLAADLEFAAAWHNAPSNAALALEVERRLGEHVIFKSICEMFDERD